jgi:DnaJ-class molecular chaperone
MSEFYRRKAIRKREYYLLSYGWVLKPCVACNGSGVYDSFGSPSCGACDGLGKTKEKGDKAINPDDYHPDIDKG